MTFPIRNNVSIAASHHLFGENWNPWNMDYNRMLHCTTYQRFSMYTYPYYPYNNYDYTTYDSYYNLRHNFRFPLNFDSYTMFDHYYKTLDSKNVYPTIFGKYSHYISIFLQFYNLRFFDEEKKSINL